MEFNRGYIFRITLISALGGFLFGYDWVVIGGAKPFYERFFEIFHSPNLQGWAMSSALLGCMVGAGVSGMISERFGRKKALILSAILFSISAIGTGSADYLFIFVIYRLIGGFGIGLASTQSPIYIAEISPGEMRGRLVSINQLTIVIGILTAQITNYLIADRVPVEEDTVAMAVSWNVQWGWRWMFWAETVPAVMFFILALLIPESPRWLVKKGMEEKSGKVLHKVGGQTYARDSIEQIRLSLHEFNEKIGIKALMGKKVFPILLIGITLAVFQQWCGINVVFNYAEEVFAAAGYGVSDILFNIVLTGTVTLIFTFVAILTVDKLGRKILLLTGAMGLSVSYIVLGSFYYLEVLGIPVLIIIIIAIAIYGMTLAPVTWVVLSEIFPNKVRETAMAVATTSLWIACFILTYTFPWLNKMLNAYGTFWLYAFICLAGFIFILKKIIETKGKTLEEVEKLLTD